MQMEFLKPVATDTRHWTAREAGLTACPEEYSKIPWSLDIEMISCLLFVSLPLSLSEIPFFWDCRSKRCSFSLFLYNQCCHLGRSEKGLWSLPPEGA